MSPSRDPSPSVPSGNVEAEHQALRVLYETAPDGHLLVDRAGVVRECNHTALEWFRARRDEVVGVPLASWFADHDAVAIAELAMSDWVGCEERRLTVRDGRRVLLSVRRQGDGRFHLAVRDITALQVLDEEDARLRSNHAMTELAGAIARDLNDPISVVQGRLEYLLEIGEDDPELVRRHLTVALEHSRRIASTLRNLRLVGHTSPTRLEAVSVQEILDEALVIGGNSLRQVKVEVDLEPAGLLAGGQQALYARLFANLLTRAAEAMRRQGTVRVIGRYRGEDVSLVVEDEGPALPQGELSNLWSMDREETRFFNLGLSIAHTIAGSVGGGIEARRRGATTCVEVWLPRPSGSRTRARPVVESLLAVGDADFARAVEALVGREGFRVTPVSRGSEALRVVGEQPVDALVSQLRLPDMSGLALTGALVERHPALANRTVLATTKGCTVAQGVAGVSLPLRRVELLQALGRRVRPRR